MAALRQGMLVLLALLVAAAGALGQQLPSLTDARLTTTTERARLIVDLSAPANFRFFALNDPMRMVVELEAGAVAFDPGAHSRMEGLVAEYRIGMINASRARAVLSLSAPAKIQQAYVLDAAGGEPARLIVDLIPDTADGFTAQVAAVAPEDIVPPTVPVPSEDPALPPEIPVVPAGNRYMIVIDPGHGGIDGGARGTDGLLEKDIVLRFAIDLQERLLATGKFDVALTRDRDEFLTLEQRVALARQNRADLFISLHADSFHIWNVRGAAIYIRDEEATDILDKVLAEQENKVDLIAGFNPPAGDEAVVDILVDLMRIETRRRAFVAAQTIVEALGRSVQLREFPLRRADFFVLQAPDVPSIMVELGFLSNPDDSTNLGDESWRVGVAGALAQGIEHYFESGD